MYISNVNSASMKFEQISRNQADKGETHSFFAEEELILIYITQGAGKYSLDADTGQFKKRDIVILNPKNQLEITPVRQMKWVQINLSGILFTSSLDIESQDHLFVAHDGQGIVQEYMNLTIIEAENRFRGTDLILKKLLEVIMVHVLRNRELSIKDSTIQAKNDEIEVVQDYIQNYYAEKITLDQLAELVDINKYYLIRLFKQKTGLSPIDYLIHVRLSEAERLLSNTDTTISQISSMVGFHSPSHFSKTFKESNHMTPSEYRKKYRANSRSAQNK